MVKDPGFYIGLEGNNHLHPFLKKENSSGYYTQVQLAMGLAGLTWCHFIVYVYKGVIIVKVDFDEQYFFEVVKSLDKLYKDYFLPHLIK